MIWWLSLLMNLHNLAACVPIQRDEIVAADLSRSVPEFAEVEPNTVVGYAPMPGSRRIFHATELRRLAFKFNVSIASDREACFEWQLRPLTVDDVVSAMRRSFRLADPSVRNAQIGILEIGTHMAPEGRITFPLTGLLPAANRNNGPALWRGYIEYSGKRRFDIWAKVKLTAPTARVVAVSNIPANHIIDATEVRLEIVEDYPIWRDVARNLEDVVGRLAQRSIATGRPVLRADLTKPVEVQAGQIVQVNVESGKARLKLQARAENSGHAGDMISLRNPRSGKMFRAQVEGKGRVLVMPGVTGGPEN